jgi:hypothetical protein
MKIIQLMQAIPLDYTDIQPFLFEKSDKPIIPVKQTDDILASPFPKFSIEIDNGWLTSNHSGGDFKIGVIYCTEIEVDLYQFAYSITTSRQVFHTTVTKNKCEVWKNNKMIKTEQTSSEMYENIKGIVYYQLQKLQKSGLGVVNTGEKAKFKDYTGRKHTYKSSNVIYVANNKHPQEAKKDNIITKGINWHESWSVAAHWRRILPESLGLSRKGVREVKGFTWVSNYRKGEGTEQLKVRKVKAN